jgi:hypothetical protein
MKIFHKNHITNKTKYKQFYNLITFGGTNNEAATQTEEFYKINVIDFTNHDMNTKLKKIYTNLIDGLQQSKLLDKSLTDLWIQIRVSHNEK